MKSWDKVFAAVYGLSGIGDRHLRRPRRPGRSQRPRPASRSTTGRALVLCRKAPEPVARLEELVPTALDLVAEAVQEPIQRRGLRIARAVDAAAALHADAPAGGRDPGGSGEPETQRAAGRGQARSRLAGRAGGRGKDRAWRDLSDSHGVELRRASRSAWTPTPRCGRGTAGRGGRARRPPQPGRRRSRH
jgi:hypothetical protein